jgi:heme-degrading monooxygenase HmoA
MLAMLIRHKVADERAWQPVFDENRMARRANGCRQEHLFRNADDPNELVILLEWDDLERARLYADSDDLHLVLRRSGVIGEPEIWFLDDAGRAST